MPDTLSFEELIHLTDRETQVLLREVDQNDLVTALIGANKKITTKFLSNMSVRVRTIIEEKIAAAGSPSKDKIEDSRQHMLQQVAELVERKQLMLPTTRKGASPVRRSKLSKQHLDRIRNLKKTTQRPLLQLSHQEINQAFVGLSEIARKEGILALEQVTQGTDEDFLNYAVRLVIDGTDPDLIMDILEAWKGSLLHEHGMKYVKVIEGIMAIQSGEDLHIIESKLKRLY
jgi:hypothetical protein